MPGATRSSMRWKPCSRISAIASASTASAATPKPRASGATRVRDLGDQAGPVGALGPQAADEPVVLPADHAVVVAVAAVAPLAGPSRCTRQAVDRARTSLRQRQPALGLLVGEDLRDRLGVAGLEPPDVHPRRGDRSASGTRRHRPCACPLTPTDLAVGGGSPERGAGSVGAAAGRAAATSRRAISGEPAQCSISCEACTRRQTKPSGAPPLHVHAGVCPARGVSTAAVLLVADQPRAELGDRRGRPRRRLAVADDHLVHRRARRVEHPAHRPAVERRGPARAARRPRRSPAARRGPARPRRRRAGGWPTAPRRTSRAARRRPPARRCPPGSASSRSGSSDDDVGAGSRRAARPSRRTRSDTAGPPATRDQPADARS